MRSICRMVRRVSWLTRDKGKHGGAVECGACAGVSASIGEEVNLMGLENGFGEKEVAVV